MEFFWYDYEAWGKKPLKDRIVQFGGVRTNEELEWIGEPIEFKCKPGLDCPIGPGAVNVHKIMPMEAHREGLPEGEFAAQIHTELSKPGTCSVAYSGMGYDHELTRVLFYRNLRDPYAWAWKNGNTMWDTIDLIRAAFLLIPEALTHWPKKEDGRVSFKLEDLSAANLEQNHLGKYHTAKADTLYMLELAKLIRERARDLWDYALELRFKKNISSIMNCDEPILHIFWKIGTKRYCATLLSSLGQLKCNQNEIFAFDLYNDPTPLLKPYQDWTSQDKQFARNSILSVKSNKSPFVCKWSHTEYLLSPALSSENVCDRIQLKESDALGRHRLLKEYINRESEDPFSEFLGDEEAKRQRRFLSHNPDPDEAIYHEFISDVDRRLMDQVLKEGAGFDWHTIQSDDPRVEPLIFRYLARNYPEILDDEGTQRWYSYCRLLQLERTERRKINADQIFSIELRDKSDPWGSLDESQVKDLLRWQNRVRELLGKNQE